MPFDDKGMLENPLSFNDYSPPDSPCEEEKNATYFPKNFYSEVSALCVQHDKLASGLEHLLEKSPFIKEKFVDELNEIRCKLYETLCTFFCQGLVYDEKKGKLHCPAECVENVNKKRRVQESVRANEDGTCPAGFTKKNL